MRAALRGCTLSVIVLCSTGCAIFAHSRAHSGRLGTAIRAHVEFLSSDALNGRGSGTRDEHIAAEYVGNHFRRIGLAPSNTSGAFVNAIDVERPMLSALPQLLAGDARWTHGGEILVLAMTDSLAGPLQHLKSAAEIADVRQGAVVFVPAPVSLEEASRLTNAGAQAVLAPASPQARKQWAVIGKAPPVFPPNLAILPARTRPTRVALEASAEAAIEGMPEGTLVRLDATFGPVERSHTWNAVGVLWGSRTQEGALLVSAHLDHLGRRPSDSTQSDQIYNGADDDASGTAAVMALAEELVRAGRPRRTIVFAAFGSEEVGGLGSRYFSERPPVPLNTIIANVHLEMLGRPDSALPPRTLWLTGYERSNLGAELARRGGRIVADPRPAENFFQRSDNYVMALRGVIAHTLSTFGLHREYHTPRDEALLIDWTHMGASVGSLVKPLAWLANSKFVPEWRPGQRP